MICWSFWVMQKIKPSISALEWQCCSDWEQFLENLIGSILVHRVVMRWLLWMQLFCHGWLICSSSSSQQSTLCRQCANCIQCGCCLGRFQICVCVSRLLSVSKFSLCQSESTLTLLCSPAGASRQSKKKSNSCVFIYLTGNPVLRHNRYFKITTTQLESACCRFEPES